MKIFWSWQSDVNQATHRHFVREVLAQVAADLSVEATEEPERPENDDEGGDEELDHIAIDHDTLGAGGSAPIAETVLRKIREAAVFVADVTPVGKTRGGKLLPNPNVLIELGYAIHFLGPERIVTVANRASGGDPKHLPFDLRHWRWPAFYNLKEAPSDEQRADAARELKAGLLYRIVPALEKARRDEKERTKMPRMPVLVVEYDSESIRPLLLPEQYENIQVKDLSAIKAETPLMPVPTQTAASNSQNASLVLPSMLRGLSRSLLSFTKEQIEQYNSRARMYYGAYEAYLDDLRAYQEMERQTFEVEVKLENNGTLPATDVDIEVTFPEGVMVWDAEKFPEEPEAPAPPEPPSHAPGYGLRDAFARALPMTVSGLQLFDGTTVNSPERKVRFHVKQLKHLHSYSSASFLVTIPSKETGSFEAHYYITAVETVEPTIGTLRFEAPMLDA